MGSNSKTFLVLSSLLLLFLPSLLQGREEKEKISPPAIGNFALPGSQQPAPLVSFGQNIFDKGNGQLVLFADAYIGNNSYATDIIPRFLYTFTDSFSMLLSVPFSPRDKSGQNHSSGIEDVLIQAEYAFLQTQNATSSTQATIVANISFPTGSTSKNPPTGFGANTYFFGATLSHTTTKWYLFLSPGVLLPDSRHGTQFGDEYWYQFGIGKNLPSSKDQIFMLMAEFDGTYSKRNKIHGHTDPNSGGNIIYITPSIYFATKRTVWQFGSGFPVVQNLYGDQPKKYLALFFNFVFTL